MRWSADAATHSIKTSAAAQQEKRPFVVGAAKFGEPMTVLWTELPLLASGIKKRSLWYLIRLECNVLTKVELERGH